MSRGVLITQHSDVSIESTFLHSFIGIACLLCHKKNDSKVVNSKVNYNLTILTIKATCSLGHICSPHEILMLQYISDYVFIYVLTFPRNLEFPINVINLINMHTGTLHKWLRCWFWSSSVFSAQTHLFMVGSWKESTTVCQDILYFSEPSISQIRSVKTHNKLSQGT